MLHHSRSFSAGISVSSLSDGLFVLHVPSDDNKQKVRPTACHKCSCKSSCWFVWLWVSTVSPGGFLPGWRGFAERPCDRDLDQDRHLRRQNQQRQHQPGQVRSSTDWVFSCMPFPAVTVSLSLRCPFSIKFTAGQGKEGIIDFTPGSELLVAKAKNGHLSVVSGFGHPFYKLRATEIQQGFYLTCSIWNDIIVDWKT